ncbi:Juvenile hormone epoxide hydrolase [Diplodia seriata]|uniref:Juvenile hormone epoxide hydrolase n=1 Tax=Diplodia seriata TaxID=420778 RepID=A0A1S8BD45_9PEZI|nr:Juvenile hormone epoxide hydrolase [Diplodia seriata]
MDRTAGEGDGGGIAFHVIAPSVPGTGFSDASDEEGFGARETAEVFDALMKRLEYGRYVAFGAGWIADPHDESRGFTVCRALALQHGPDSCVAIHAANPASFFLPPSLQNTPLEWLKYQLARMTGARISGLSFDYVPADFDNVSRPAAAIGGKTKVVDEETAGQPELHMNGEPTSNGDVDMGETTCTASRPQTLAFALCDSPVGLLAHTLDVLGPCLAMGRAGYLSAVWTPETLLNWTMMRWLPGPEAGFRWVQRARRDAEVGGCLWRMHSGVPLGISQFGAQRGVGGRPDGVLRWARAWQNVRWLKKREGSNVIRPEWESPEELVQDLRESFGSVWNDGNKV